ncbi:MAG: DotI/IcmL/TraM family protein, partial [Alphaproteobacteria bacterium]|nr:DotI/IcmL/TraM family protein [Alphaproteobacteria bacterium]
MTKKPPPSDNTTATGNAESPKTASAAPEASGQKGKDKKTKIKIPYLDILRSLTSEFHAESVIADEKDSFLRHRRLMTLIGAQGLAIGILTVILILGAPVLRPIFIYKYKTLSPGNLTKELIPLFNPNLTNRAILSWTANSVTEILTLGFGDFAEQLVAQRKRFTADGWKSFLRALNQRKFQEAFKERQLILTSVPSDIPVIVSQGPDPDYDYRW